MCNVLTTSISNYEKNGCFSFGINRNDFKRAKTRIFVNSYSQYFTTLRSGTINLPKPITSQKLNDYIKVIGERAGIDDAIMQIESKGGKRQEVTYKKYEKIQIHTARRSFATNAYLSGIPAISIMKITGHQTESVFMRYICISNEENALKMSDSDFFK
jgi:integrase